MNKQNLQTLIIHLKTQTTYGFNMSYYVAQNATLPDNSPNNCGTVACIAGHAYHLAQNYDLNLKGATDREILMMGVARDWLGITQNQSYQLFWGELPEDEKGCRKQIPMNNITLDQALKVLEHLKTTGEVDWSIIDE